MWAIEDCRDLSHHLEQALLAAGERVVRVAPKLMGASRRGEREPGNSDQIDARAIGRAVLREGIKRFPVAFLDEDAMEIRLLCDHREALVNERKRLVSSGRHDRHRLDRGGNRQLNRALHVIAITRGRIDPETRAYLARKEAEGKSRMEAMRCLKRHLARHYHRLLQLSPASPHEAVVPARQATALVRCLT